MSPLYVHHYIYYNLFLIQQINTQCMQTRVWTIDNSFKLLYTFIRYLQSHDEFIVLYLRESSPRPTRLREADEVEL